MGKHIHSTLEFKKTIREVEEICLLRDNYDRNCRDCIYYGGLCNEYKLLYGLRPSIHNTQLIYNYKEDNRMIIKGKLIKCKREVKEFKGRKTEEKLFLTLSEVELKDEQLAELKDAFKDAGKQFTPDFILDFKGYVNLSTKFELPARLVDTTEVTSIEDVITDGYKWLGADVRVSINVKDGAIYPKAIVFDTEGTSINSFEEFDN